MLLHSLQFLCLSADLIFWSGPLERTAFCVGFHDVFVEYSRALLKAPCAFDSRRDCRETCR